MAVEDVGRIINPLTLHGQTVGAIVQGLGGALLENLVYDADGQFLAGSLADYLLPTASDFPVIRAHALEEKPAPHNPLGAKGAGEGGIIPVGGVIANAVANALGVEPNVLPLSPPKVWELISAEGLMFVMAGLVPAIHAFLGRHQGVDARHKAGHDVDGLSCHSATMNDATNMAAHKQSAEILIERARSLIPVLRERAKQASADRRIPQRNHRRYPPLRTDPLPAAFDVRRLCLGLSRVLENAPHPGAGLRLDGVGLRRARRAQLGDRQLFRASPARRVGQQSAAVASASVPPSGHSRKIAGGHRVNGRWGFASGVDHAQWMLLNAVVKDGGEAAGATVSHPDRAGRDRRRLARDGVGGTGSKSVVVKDVVVAAPIRSACTISRPARARRRRASRPPDVPHAAKPAGIFLAELGQCRPGRARGRGIHRHFTRERRSRGLRVADLEAVQLAVAEAAAQAETAAMLVEQTIDRNIRLVESGAEITAERVAWTRRNSSYATQALASPRSRRSSRSPAAPRFTPAIHCRKFSATPWPARRICR